LPASSTSKPLPLLHRLAIAYLLLPVAVFLLGWFQWWLALPFTVLLVIAISPLLRGPWRPDLSRDRLLRHAAILGLALAWLMLTGAGGVFDTNTNADWIKNDAILLDMSRSPWPTLLPTEGNRPEPLLRYYLGYYMVPALAGRWLGAAALNWAVPLWTFAGTGLLALLFARHFRGWAVLLALAILMLFSGMDILRVLLLQDLDGIHFGRSHIEWDYGQGLHVQYSSNMVGLMYVPQHFIATGLYCLLLLELRQHRGLLGACGVLFAACLFWSPFVAIGLLPLLLVLLADHGLRPFLSWQNFLAAVPLAILLLVYLFSGSANFPQGWLWEKYTAGQLLAWLPLFFFNQFGLLALLLWVLRPELRRDGLFHAALATLLLLPWYHYGYFNDLAMRASLPALFLLCYFSAETICRDWPQGMLARPRGALLTLFIVLCAGAVTPAFEVARVLNFDDGQRRRYEQLEYSTLITVHRFFRGQYAARNMPGWYASLLREHESRGTVDKDKND